MSDTATRVLTAVDRCDRCSAQAYVRHAKGDLTMDFCAHHDKVHAPGLLAQGFVVVIDESIVLTTPV